MFSSQSKLQRTVCRQELTRAHSGIGAGMAPGANSKISIGVIPAEILQHICSLLQDPDDLASCHLVDTRCARHVEDVLFTSSRLNEHV